MVEMPNKLFFLCYFSFRWPMAQGAGSVGAITKPELHTVRTSIWKAEHINLREQARAGE